VQRLRALMLSLPSFSKYAPRTECHGTLRLRWHGEKVAQVEVAVVRRHIDRRRVPRIRIRNMAASSHRRRWTQKRQRREENDDQRFRSARCGVGK
jgi:hypothetical protein